MSRRSEACDSCSKLLGLWHEERKYEPDANRYLQALVQARATNLTLCVCVHACVCLFPAVIQKTQV